jgi:putative endonuclease
MKTYVVYILECSDDSFYTGITGNFDKRIMQHETGYFKQCYTFKKRPLAIKYYVAFTDVIQAILFEKKLKGWTRAKKIALIQNDFDNLQILAECRNFTHFKFKPYKSFDCAQDDILD